MFFCLAKTVDNNFPNHYAINDGYVNCDNGWTQYHIDQRTVLAKGYANNHSLEQLVHQWDLHDQGNYCIIRSGSTIEIKHNINRGFPLFRNQQAVSNFYRTWSPLWADDAVTVDSNWNVNTNKIDLDFDIVSVDDPVQTIFDLLVSDVNNFFKHNKVVPQLYCSGGVDTVLLVALLEYTQHPYILINSEHYESDYFTTTNQSQLSEFWAYNQIHHWIEPTTLVTGGCGDEYFLRGPAAIALLTAWNNIDFLQTLNPQHYHYRYFHKYPDLWNNSWNQRQQLQEQYPTELSLKRQILNMLYNDHQHWHLGNTTTWCPFKNIRISQILLGMAVKDLLGQFVDAEITKKLIQKACARILPVISSQKNYNSTENLAKLQTLLKTQ